MGCKFDQVSISEAELGESGVIEINPLGHPSAISSHAFQYVRRERPVHFLAHSPPPPLAAAPAHLSIFILVITS